MNPHLLYVYWWNTRIFPFTKKSYLHCAQWRYYFYLSHVRILALPWLLTWLANYKRASRSGARPVLLTFHWQNCFEVQRWYSYRWLSRRAAKFSHRYFFWAWRTFRKICPPLPPPPPKKKGCVLCRNFISIYKINRTLHGCLGIRILSSRAESLPLISFVHSWEILSALEDKIRIPAWPCNILYISGRPLPPFS